MSIFLPSYFNIDPNDLNPLMRRILSYINKNHTETIYAKDLAHQIGTDTHAFSKYFQKKMGLSPMRWLTRYRCYLALDSIHANPNCKLTDVAFDSGFKSSSHFSRVFKKEFHVSPTQYKLNLKNKSTPQIEMFIYDSKPADTEQTF